MSADFFNSLSKDDLRKLVSTYRRLHWDFISSEKDTDTKDGDVLKLMMDGRPTSPVCQAGLPVIYYQWLRTTTWCTKHCPVCRIERILKKTVTYCQTAKTQNDLTGSALNQ